jgi:hypothetical protein
MKTFIKRLVLTYLPALLFLAASIQCKSGGDEVPKTLKEKIQGKTYILGTVIKGTANVTSDFTGFRISFNADGTAGNIQNNLCEPKSANVSLNIGDQTITLSGSTPSCFSNVLTNVSTDTDGSTLQFTTTINLSEIVITPVSKTSGGVSEYVFNLVKQ